MPGQRCLHRNARRFLVTNLAQHNHVGILTHNRTQSFGEGHAAATVHRHLVNPRQTIFHRILQRNNVARRRIQLGQRRIERRRLAAASWAGKQD